MRVEILPSLLAADFGYLADAARRAAAAGGDQLHLDIMDGHFVPNLSMGPDVVAMAKRTVAIPRSVHLMLTNPDRYAERFVEAGADSLLIHIEAPCNVRDVLREIRRLGARPGITLKPETPAEDIFPMLGEVDEVLCMTVEPGYGGQAFMRGMLSKIRAIRTRAVGEGMPELDILVDGGINEQTAAECAAAGANLLVAGTALFRSEDMGRAVDRMRSAAEASFMAQV